MQIVKFPRTDYTSMWSFTIGTPRGVAQSQVDPHEAHGVDRMRAHTFVKAIDVAPAALQISMSRCISASPIP